MDYEVTIKGKRLLQAEPLHDGERERVCQIDCVIVVSQKQFASIPMILLGFRLDPNRSARLD